jgi:hypothetical protein
MWILHRKGRKYTNVKRVYSRALFTLKEANPPPPNEGNVSMYTHYGVVWGSVADTQLLLLKWFCRSKRKLLVSKKFLWIVYVLYIK